MDEQAPAETYEAAVREFLASVDGRLTAEDAPARVSLVKLAIQLDELGFHAQTYSQWALTYRHLLKRIGGGDDHDPLQGLLFDG